MLSLLINYTRAPQIALPENQPQFSQMTKGQYWFSKTKLSDRYEMLCYGILKTFCSMAKGMDLIFSLFSPTLARGCLLAYCRTYNAFFMDLPVSSFMFHLSLLTTKNVNLVVALLHNAILNHPYFSLVIEKIKNFKTSRD